MSNYTYECASCAVKLISTDADELADAASAHADFHAMIVEKAAAGAKAPGMAIRSFSGVFEFSRRIFDQIDELEPDTADYFTELIEMGLCPRCENYLPVLPEFPAGSRVTQCRSIPICGPCGSDEIYDFNSTHPAEWPLDIADIEARKTAAEVNAVPATITAIDGELKLLTDDGVSDIRMGPPTGGWAQYGPQDGTFEN